MAKRKTFNLKEFVEFANKQLARTDEEATREFKMGISVIVEHVLMRANNYHGFNYNEWTHRGGYDKWVKDGKPDFPEKNTYLHSDYGGEFDIFYYFSDTFPSQT